MITSVLNSNRNIRFQTEKKGAIIGDPIVSIVIPVYNQELFVRNHLVAITRKIHNPFELIIINDASSDKTHIEVTKFINELDSTKFTSIKYYKTFWPWYETKCDHFGITKAKGKYIIEIQSDMLILEEDFDLRLIKALESDNTLFAISARGVCDIKRVFDSCLKLDEQSSFLRSVTRNIKSEFRSKLARLKVNYPKETRVKDNESIDLNAIIMKIFPSEDPYSEKQIAGFLDSLIEVLPYSGETEISKSIERNLGKVWIGETVMRGPLIFERSKYLKIGGLNTEAFFLGNDDQEMILRARKAGYKVGYSPIRFSSPLSLGSTRAKKTLSSKTWFLIHKFARRKKYLESSLYESAVKAADHV